MSKLHFVEICQAFIISHWLLLNIVANLDVPLLIIVIISIVFFPCSVSYESCFLLFCKTDISF